jgi:hypothetical protein
MLNIPTDRRYLWEGFQAMLQQARLTVEKEGVSQTTMN